MNGIECGRRRDAIVNHAKPIQARVIGSRIGKTDNPKCPHVAWKLPLLNFDDVHVYCLLVQIFYCLILLTPSSLTLNAFNLHIRMQNPTLGISLPLLPRAFQTQIIIEQKMNQHSSYHQIRDILAHALTATEAKSPEVVSQIFRLVLEEALGTVLGSVFSPEVVADVEGVGVDLKNVECQCAVYMLGP